MPKFFGIAVLLSLCAGVNLAQVKSIQAKTADGLVISLWIVEEFAQTGRDVEVQYSVENKNSKTVYLVKKQTLEFETSSDEIRVNPFTVGFDEHGATDYSFDAIRSSEIYRGQFVIPAERLTRNGIWQVKVELAFVDNIEGLQPRKLPSRDPAAFRGLLAQRATLISLGNLYLLVK